MIRMLLLAATLACGTGCDDSATEQLLCSIDHTTGGQTCSGSGITVALTGPASNPLELVLQYDVCPSPPQLIGVYSNGTIELRNTSGTPVGLWAIDWRLVPPAGEACHEERAMTGTIGGYLDGENVHQLPVEVHSGGRLTFDVPYPDSSGSAITEACGITFGGCHTVALRQEVTLHLVRGDENWRVELAADHTYCWEDADMCMGG